MRRVVQTLSWIALAGTVLPSLLFLMGKVELSHVKTVMLAAAVLWFAATPMWMGRGAGTGG